MIISFAILAVCLLVLLLVFLLKFKYPIGKIIRSKHHLEFIYDSIPDPIVTIEKDFRISRVNRAFAEYTKKRFPEIIGRKCHDVFFDQSSICEGCPLQEVFTSGRKHKLIRKMENADGKECYFHFFLFPARSKQSGEIVSVVEYIQDVTKEIEAKERLETAKTDLEVAYQQISNEVDMAREIQEGILPKKYPKIDGVQFTAKYCPIEAVGGDLYDFIDLGNFRIGIFMGDVSGHGLPSAFIGAMSKMALYSHTKPDCSPKEVMARMNVDLNHNISTGHYLTGFYGILDLGDNSFTYTRASHPYPIVVRKDGTINKLDTSGIFIGMVEDPDYKEETIYLNKGDRLYLFTDGYFEIYRGKEVVLGYDDFTDLLRDVSSMPLTKSIEKIEDIVQGYYDDVGVSDDRSIVGVEITEDSRIERFRLLCDFNSNEEIVVGTFNTVEEGEQYVSMVLKEMDVHGFMDQTIRHMKVVLYELIANAAEHGNKFDDQKRIDLAYSVDNQRVKVSVVDEGHGFHHKDIPDPTLEENILKDRGRGIFIIREFVDEVKQNPTGNRTTIIKYKNPNKIKL